MGKKNTQKRMTTGTVMVRDLRDGDYKKLPPKKFAGNIFLTGNEFYEVMPKGNWRKITGLEERKKLLMELGVKYVPEAENA